MDMITTWTWVNAIVNKNNFEDDLDNTFDAKLTRFGYSLFFIFLCDIENGNKISIDTLYSRICIKNWLTWEDWHMFSTVTVNPQDDKMEQVLI